MNGVYELPDGFGKFEYKFHSDTLHIVLPVSFSFVDGSRFLSPGFSDDKYTWPTGGDYEKEWEDAFMFHLQESWASTFDLMGFSTGLEDQRVKLDFAIEKRPAKPIWRITVIRDPGDAGTAKASVCGPRSRHFGAGCAPIPVGECWGSLSIMSSLLNPTGVLTREDDQFRVLFNDGQQAIADEGRLVVEIDSMLRRLVEENNQWKVLLVGSAIPYEVPAPVDFKNLDHPAITLAMARADSLKELLNNYGVNNGKIILDINNPFKHDHSEEISAVDLIMISEAQSTIGHEIGHFFGLDDEYAYDDVDVGQPMLESGYTHIVNKYGYALPSQGPSRSIMSNGNDLFPRHFVPFLEVMSKIDSSRDWYLVPALS